MSTVHENKIEEVVHDAVAQSSSLVEAIDKVVLYVHNRSFEAHKSGGDESIDFKTLINKTIFK